MPFEEFYDDDEFGICGCGSVGCDCDEEDDEVSFTCLFPDKCCMPSFQHTSDECYTAEDFDEYVAEMAKLEAIDAE